MPEPSDRLTAIFPLPTDTESANEREFPPEYMKRMKPLDRVLLKTRVGALRSALRELQEMLASADAPTRAHCYFTAGQIRERMREWDAARTCYEEAVFRLAEGEGNRYFAWNNLGYCQNRLGRHEQAERSCREAIAIDPNQFNAHKNLAIALEALGHFTEAAESYQRSFRAAPDEQIAFRRLRFLLAKHPQIHVERPDLGQDVERQLAHGRRDWPKAVAVRALEDEEILRRVLGSIQIYEPLIEGDFQVFGLYGQHGDGLAYRTLDEAMSERGIEVMEISESGSVPTIRVVNRTKFRIFAMAGEELVGAKQNRVLNASILLGAGTDLNLPVSCVERGRWSYRTPQFESRRTSSHYALRHMMSRHSYDSYLAKGTPGSDQGQVWGEVERVLETHGTKSPSRALHDVYEQAGDRLDKVTESLRPREHWSGAAFAFGGMVVGLDLFDRPETLAKLWPMLIRAYALDVVERPASRGVSREHVEDWIRSSASAVMDAFRSPGIGMDFRLESDRHVGAALMVDGTPVHLEMFYESDV